MLVLQINKTMSRKHPVVKLYSKDLIKVKSQFLSKYICNSNTEECQNNLAEVIAKLTINSRKIINKIKYLDSNNNYQLYKSATYNTHDST